LHIFWQSCKQAAPICICCFDHFNNLPQKKKHNNENKKKSLLKKHVKICKRLKTLCTLMGSSKGWSYPFFPLPVARCPENALKMQIQPATGKRQRYSHVQISTCQFMIMAPHEPKQNVNYTPPTK